MSKKKFFRDLSSISHQLSPRSGFTLIEILIIFLIGSIVVSIGINSVSSYNNSQIFNQSVSDVFSTLNNTRSRAISQVKPAPCGVSILSGFEVEINVSSGTYKQNAVCGTSRHLLNEDKVSSGVSFLSGSNTRIFFNVGKGTVDTPMAIGIIGYGKTSTIIINETGVVAIQEGTMITPFLSPSPTPTPGAGATGIPTSTMGLTWYSDGTFSKSGTSGTAITVFATGAKPSAVFNLVAGTDGGGASPPCSQDTIILAANNASGNTGFIPFTGAPVSLSPGTWQICFKEAAGITVTNPVIFTVIGGGATITPPTSTPVPATSTPAPTTVTTGSTSVSITSITPNPATRSSAQSMTFAASVTGTNCTPVGTVEFFRNSETTRFTAGTTSSSNPATASGPYNSGAFTVGSHQIHARFVPGGGSCPMANSSIVNLTVN